MGQYGSWYDQTDQGTKDDMHDAWLERMEIEARLGCKTCKDTRKIPDPTADPNHGSWFVPCPMCSHER